MARDYGSVPRLRVDVDAPAGKDRRVHQDSARPPHSQDRTQEVAQENVWSPVGSTESRP